ncbi:Uncharacterised protein [Staphylococcus gallinarum]|uniref:Uncharacterized protein n=1 Tax=Staphylococcus gallinarum TaxID=1293 RepID=A0A380FJT5_STAGA|nr:Uncharacterised protein [Staphylococcus gallinarum]
MVKRIMVSAMHLKQTGMMMKQYQTSYLKLNIGIKLIKDRPFDSMQTVQASLEGLEGYPATRKYVSDGVLSNVL